MSASRQMSFLLISRSFHSELLQYNFLPLGPTAFEFCQGRPVLGRLPEITNRLATEKLNGINFLDWFCNLRIVLKQERKEYVIEELVPNDPSANASRADKDKFKKHMDDMVDVGCLMLATMTPELQKQHKDMVAYEMIKNLKEIYEGQSHQEKYETSKALFQCKMSEGSLVGAHVIKMMGYIQALEKLQSTQHLDPKPKLAAQALFSLSCAPTFALLREKVFCDFRLIREGVSESFCSLVYSGELRRGQDDTFVETKRFK
ncbi:hypothetical protein V6N12_068306 [Hibiscus sabdariffa]|uniref:Zinc finger, CCHC-type n=1 Tax=Hibiscus sabdariffa TaxID=183260 RepID=A0ABR2FPL3_9ROSI